MDRKFICNRCGTETLDVPPYKNSTCPRCGKGRFRIFIKCTCGNWFNPPRYSQKFCSPRCKVVAQSTGRKTERVTIPKARTAQSLVAYHIKMGHIHRPDACEECGKRGQRIEAAHYNYVDALNVRWLCRSCHTKWDKQTPKNATYPVKLLLAP